MPPCASSSPRLTDYLPPSWSVVGVLRAFWRLDGLSPSAYLRRERREERAERRRGPWDVLQDKSRDGALKGQGLAII